MSRLPRSGCRESRFDPSRSWALRRLGYDLVDAERGQFYIRREGCKVNETADLFGHDLAGIEQWIKENFAGACR